MSENIDLGDTPRPTILRPDLEAKWIHAERLLKEAIDRGCRLEDKYLKLAAKIRERTQRLQTKYANLQYRPAGFGDDRRRSLLPCCFTRRTR